MKETIKIVILSRDRPQYLKESLDSVLNQKYSGVKLKIVVSDNSEGDEVNELIKRHYVDSDIEYIRRDPPIPSRAHFQIIISECQEKYVVLFHDDDVMHPNYIKTISPFIQKEGVVAVSCNAFLCENGISKSKNKSHYFTSCKRFDNEKDFLEQYLLGSCGVAPFPGYIYQSNFLKKISLAPLPGAKYFDVILLSTILRYGLILWIPDSLMYYRIHDSNDSNFEDVAGRMALLNYMSKQGLDKNRGPLLMSRFIFWLKWILERDKRSILLWRNRIVFKFLFIKLFYLASELFFWKKLFNFIKK